jgi:pSer/pThr/pTyr-binding forkhead associated (FHA) protein
LNTKKQQFERDPLTQPVRIRQEETQPTAAAPSPSIPRSLAGLSAPARLIYLSEGGHPIPTNAILLNRREITFGSDAAQVTDVLEDPSVNPLHARLVYSDGAFIISDLQSVAGTWVNYTPVSSLGVQLEHGDVIHIGRVVFRFELSVPPEQKKPRVLSL